MPSKQSPEMRRIVGALESGCYTYEVVWFREELIIASVQFDSGAAVLRRNRRTFMLTGYIGGNDGRLSSVPVDRFYRLFINRRPEFGGCAWYVYNDGGLWLPCTLEGWLRENIDPWMKITPQVWQAWNKDRVIL